jgi:hypothetical protein
MGIAFCTSWQFLQDDAEEPHCADAGRGHPITAMAASMMGMSKKNPKCLCCISLIAPLKIRKQKRLGNNICSPQALITG